MKKATPSKEVQRAAYELGLDPFELIEALGDCVDVGTAALKLGVSADALASFFPLAGYEAPAMVTVSVLTEAREELVCGELVDGLELNLPTHTLHFQNSTFTLTPNAKIKESETTYILYFSKAIIRAVEKDSLAKRVNAVNISITGLADKVTESKITLDKH